MARTAIEVRPISGSVGAEISGVDLCGEVSDETIAAIRKAWLEHCVIFFREQNLPPARFLTFAKRFGEVIEYPFIKGLEEYPEIIPVIKLEHEKTNFGGIWHSDTAYLETPPMATMLVAREVPPQGGDTMFANTYLAYETLSEGMKKMLDGLVGINTSAKADASRTREDRIKASVRSDAKEEYVGEHPVVRTHPETGRKALYVNVGHTLRFRDMTVAESQPILEFLFQHQIKPEFTCRFNWRPGSIAFWDNRCALHFPVNDYHGYRRVMHRITLKGDRPH
jgi:taurine dioxygenase